ncbi:hypothetical protein VNI00_017527 [Paramarasmius palmivorus]|uniref:Uncharacterized protein n=1 Tax=Paramarasmius palmivorus TaxID=297713 RepID=A0AAW0B4Q5_9AGAR
MAAVGLREALNRVHWHHGRMNYFLVEAEAHLRESQRAAALVEELYAEQPRDAVTVSDDDDDDSMYDDPETDELIRQVRSPTATPSRGTTSSSRSQRSATPQPSSSQTRTQRVRESTPTSTPTAPRSSFPPRLAPSTPQTPRTPQKKSKNKPAGGYVILFGKNGVSGVFQDWALGAGPVYTGAKGAIVQGYATFDAARKAWSAVESSGLIAYLSHPTHKEDWFVVLAGAEPGVCQREGLMGRIGMEYLEHIKVEDILVSSSQKEALAMFRRGRA